MVLPRSGPRLLDDNVYTFVVANDANKIEIKEAAVEAIFNVKVTEDLHAQPQGEAQAQPPGPASSASEPNTKRAIVALAPRAVSNCSGADDI